MSAWGEYAKTATRSTGGDWVNPPADIYTCIVQDVSDPVWETNPFAKDEDDKEQLRFYITWEIEDDLDDGEGGSTKGLTFRQYMNLPQAYIDGAALNEKSWAFQVMEALGYDMGGADFYVNPEEWIGKSCRVTTELKKNDRGDERVKVKSLTPVRRERSTPARETREPAAAGNSRSGGSVRERLRGD